MVFLVGHNLCLHFHGKNISENCWSTMYKAHWRIKIKISFKFLTLTWFQNKPALQFPFFLNITFCTGVKSANFFWKSWSFFFSSGFANTPRFSCSGTVIMALILSWFWHPVVRDIGLTNPDGTAGWRFTDCWGVPHTFSKIASWTD